MTFLTKEPDTIKWIESFDNDMVFWDVGANIGIFSCFAAKEKRARTCAFEPSMFNLKVLKKNIFKSISFFNALFFFFYNLISLIKYNILQICKK